LIHFSFAVGTFRCLAVLRFSVSQNANSAAADAQIPQLYAFLHGQRRQFNAPTVADMFHRAPLSPNDPVGSPS
jgi:hypothetical protein